MPETLGEILRSLRLRKDLSQGQVQYMSGITKATISDIEAGKTKNPGILTITRLLVGMGYNSVDYLLQSADILPAPQGNPGPSTQEQELLDVIRAIPTRHVRETTRDLLIGFSTVARDADLARQRLQPRALLAEEAEDYEEKE